ncbi:unnamed protein product [Callosobruchus maculatus]|uniref:Uncharacterized protein n=1 Tax=Callosobruchus maculatus TaxID=64391 RepID=A0A653BKF2_CALMS|nr:unnamed protein product [Callosobruchus maculatus]
MYVIYPADEVVYLSYGRLMYVPLPPQPNQNRQQEEEPPAPEDTREPKTPAPQPVAPTKSKPRKSTGSDQSRTSSIDRPGTSGYNSLDRPKRSSVEGVAKLKPKLPPSQTGSLERSKPPRSPEGTFSTGSNKSSKSSKQSSGSSKSRSQTGVSKEKNPLEASVRPRTFSDTRTIKAAPKIDKLSSNSFRSTLSTPEPTPVRPERRRERLPGPSPSTELLRVEIPRSDIINTRSDQCENVRSEKPPVKREKSPVLRFFRAQSSSPRNATRDKPSPFDFDVSGRTSNATGTKLKPKVGSDSNLLTGKVASTSDADKEKGLLRSFTCKKIFGGGRRSRGEDGGKRATT